MTQYLRVSRELCVHVVVTPFCTSEDKKQLEILNEELLKREGCLAFKHVYQLDCKSDDMFLRTHGYAGEIVHDVPADPTKLH